MSKMPENYSLIIPSWYPTKHTPVNGIFVLKHVQLIAQFTKVQVLYASPALQSETFKVTENTNNGIQETIVYYKESGGKLFNQILLLRALYKGFNQINQKQGKPSVIHNHVVFPAGFFALFISIVYRIPLLITEHWTGYSDHDGRYAKLSLLHHFIIRWAFNRAKGVSVISAFLKNVLLEKKLCDEQKIVITPNVLNLPLQLPEKKAESTQNIKAICVANLDDNQKNISGLIEAVAEVVKLFPSFTLTLLGSGSDRELLEQKAKQIGLLNKNIVFAGSVANNKVSDYYHSHHFFILNSNFETFSIATAEAIINGLPVVVTKCGGPEEFLNESNGILVEKRNSQQLAEAIKKMIETYLQYDSSAISKSILSHYSNEQVKEDMKRLYAFISAT